VPTPYTTTTRTEQELTIRRLRQLLQSPHTATPSTLINGAVLPHSEFTDDQIDRILKDLTRIDTTRYNRSNQSTVVVEQYDENTFEVSLSPPEPPSEELQHITARRIKNILESYNFDSSDTVTMEIPFQTRTDLKYQLSTNDIHPDQVSQILEELSAIDVPSTVFNSGEKGITVEKTDSAYIISLVSVVE